MPNCSPYPVPTGYLSRVCAARTRCALASNVIVSALLHRHSLVRETRLHQSSLTTPVLSQAIAVIATGIFATGIGSSCWLLLPPRRADKESSRLLGISNDTAAHMHCDYDAITSRSPTKPSATARLRMIQSPRMWRESLAATCAPSMAPMESPTARRMP